MFAAVAVLSSHRSNWGTTGATPVRRLGDFAEIAPGGNPGLDPQPVIRTWRAGLAKTCCAGTLVTYGAFVCIAPLGRLGVDGLVRKEAGIPNNGQQGFDPEFDPAGFPGQRPGCSGQAAGESRRN